MLRNPAWQAIDTLTRRQLRMVRCLGDSISLTADDHRRALDLDNAAWEAWEAFLTDDGPLPANPPLPDMLQRLGQVAYHLSLLAERRSVSGGSQ